MSRIGRKPIDLPSGVSVEVSSGKVKVKGPKGELSENAYPGIDIKVEESSVVFENTDPADRKLQAMFGTMRALVNNMITGVTSGFSKQMQVFGTGFNVKEQGGKLILNVGYCHTVDIPVPKGISIEIKTAATKGNDVPAVFTISGIDKQQLGQFAANVRAARPPEPYQGKGVRYADEFVRRKVGKAFAS
ncbi:50S ribosomal protein L6 [Sedimentisphaera cyanobacteriorum]|uniref:Large ribosomal subunit protein uL6 n=1 Tax=Sedimentisphaera cyanobacteriorum TaxID=1940790 RepID=A0A1Q2HQ91_9BACT|nr:50S ribosomal protein L6 [Sedimentisphaera cyanobacteriorum]AQQ09416.1 50S ribosomal protein L6 [Sedimentisphaera cyanobacteriorum]